MIELLKNWMSYQEWADAIFLKFWEKVPTAIDDVELRERWNHVTSVQNSFLKLLKNEPVEHPAQEKSLAELITLKQKSRENHQNFKEFVSNLTIDDLQRTIHVPWFPEPACVATVTEALTQVVMHTQHHRGQNIMRLKELGGNQFIIDWIIWLWKGKPTARWD